MKSSSKSGTSRSLRLFKAALLSTDELSNQPEASKHQEDLKQQQQQQYQDSSSEGQQSGQSASGPGRARYEPTDEVMLRQWLKICRKSTKKSLFGQYNSARDLAQSESSNRSKAKSFKAPK